jgi:hypothetical protein
MSLNALIEKVVKKQKERRMALPSEFNELVVKIANGMEPDPDAVAEVLNRADKTPEDLSEAVKLLNTRRQLREQLDALPKLTAERKKIERQIASADAELEAAEKKHAETVYPLQSHIELLKEQIWAGERAETKLLETCSDQNFVDQLADIRFRLTGAAKLASEKQTLIDDLYESAKNLRVAAEKDKAVIGNKDRSDALIDSAKRYEKKAAEVEAELARIQKAVAELKSQENAVHNLMLVP